MVTTIKKGMDPSEIEIVLKKKKSDIEKQREDQLRKHFGALKRGLDGLEYQKEMRDDWK